MPTFRGADDAARGTGVCRNVTLMGSQSKGMFLVDGDLIVRNVYFAKEVEQVPAQPKCQGRRSVRLFPTSPHGVEPCYLYPSEGTT